MSSQIASSVFFSLSATDLSAYVRSVTLNTPVATQDATTMGSGGWSAAVAGLKSWSVTVEFVQDFASGALDSILWNLHGTATGFVYRPNSASVSTSNPQYSGGVIVSYDSPANGSVGDLMTTSVTLTGSGTLVRATS